MARERERTPEENHDKGVEVREATCSRACATLHNAKKPIDIGEFVHSVKDFLPPL